LRTGPDSYFLLSCDPTLVSVLQEHTGHRTIFLLLLLQSSVCRFSGLVLFGSLSQLFLLSDFFAAWSHDWFLASISVADVLPDIVFELPDQRLEFFLACVVLL
jgi:hypothetical protein